MWLVMYLIKYYTNFLWLSWLESSLYIVNVNALYRYGTENKGILLYYCTGSGNVVLKVITNIHFILHFLLGIEFTVCWSWREEVLIYIVSTRSIIFSPSSRFNIFETPIWCSISWKLKVLVIRPYSIDSLLPVTCPHASSPGYCIQNYYLISMLWISLLATNPQDHIYPW